MPMMLSNPRSGVSVTNVIDDELEDSDSEDSDLMEEDLDKDEFRNKEEYGDFHYI